MFLPKMFFAYISYTSFQIQMISGKNVAQKKFSVHMDFKKLEGTLLLVHWLELSDLNQIAETCCIDLGQSCQFCFDIFDIERILQQNYEDQLIFHHLQCV